MTQQSSFTASQPSLATLKAKKTPLPLLGRIVWIYSKYQIITKTLLSLVLIPLFSTFLNFLLLSAGKTNISSGDYLPFLFSFQGLGVLILGLFFLVLVMGIDIVALIVISSKIQEGELNISTYRVFKVALSSLKHFFSVKGLLLLLYLSLLVPLLGVIGSSLSPLQGFEIPNFIFSVILNNPLYFSLYLLVLVLTFIFSTLHIFTIHFLVLREEEVGQALASSRALLLKHWKSFFLNYLWLNFKIFLQVVGGIIVLALAFWLVALVGSFGLVGQRTWMLFAALVIFTLLLYAALMAIPIAIHILTKLFYRYLREDSVLSDGNGEEKEELNQLHKEAKKVATPTDDASSLQPLPYQRFKRSTLFLMALGLSIFIAGNGLTAHYLAQNFKTLFPKAVNIEVIAHRAGGNLAAENSLLGLEKAIEQGASWAEFDVQRTLDGQYIINHDPTFKRLTGDPHSAQELTLAQIRQLAIADKFDSSRPSQPVPTLMDFIRVAKHKIGLFVELKGVSADPQMVDDVVALLKQEQMLQQSVLLSLDYELIKYIVAHYPEVKTGYLYFFALGNKTKLEGNYMIMEEREASANTITALQAVGKKAIVWTVNTPESIERFVNSDVNGIITDNVPAVQEALQKAAQRSDFEVMLNRLFSLAP